MKYLTLCLVLLATVASSLCDSAPDVQRKPEIKFVKDGLSGTGTTTRYWDCCKPSCAWKEIHDPPIVVCAADGVTVVDPSVQSGCLIDGSAYTCTNQGPFKVNNTLAYGFAAASFTGKPDTSFCCGCLLWTFTDQIEGKQMIVQVTNTGNDEGVTANSFDIAMPGGGVGLNPLGCERQWNAPTDGWGDQYGGVESEEGCNQLPSALQPGCKFRFDWMEGASNPGVTFQEVECPAEIVAISGCKR